MNGYNIVSQNFRRDTRRIVVNVFIYIFKNNNRRIVPKEIHPLSFV